MMNGRPLKASRGIVACVWVFTARWAFVVSHHTQSRYSVGTSLIPINTMGKVLVLTTSTYTCSVNADLHTYLLPEHLRKHISGDGLIS